MNGKTTYNGSPVNAYQAQPFHQEAFERFLKYQARKRKVRTAFITILVINSLLNTSFGMEIKHDVQAFAKNRLEHVVGKEAAKDVFKVSSYLSDKVVSYVKASFTWDGYY